MSGTAEAVFDPHTLIAIGLTALAVVVTLLVICINIDKR